MTSMHKNSKNSIFICMQCMCVCVCVCVCVLHVQLAILMKADMVSSYMYRNAHFNNSSEHVFY